MKNKRKLEKIPDGLVVNRVWLKAHEINGPLVDYYIRKGYLEMLAYGAYRRPGPPLKWQHLVYSLQLLGYTVHVGGRSALELHGFAHYLPLGKKQIVHLFMDKQLPGWLNKTTVNISFVQHSLILFNKKTKTTGLTTIPFGSWDWPINVALPERAILEMLAGVPGKESFHMVKLFMENALNLRPNLLIILLENCTNIKVKRLFLWLADHYRHQWFDRLDLKNVNLGRGKRVIQKGGKLDSKYLITVPKEDVDGQKQSIF